MQTPETLSMQSNVQEYLEFIKNNSPELCLNARLVYEITDCSYEEKMLTLTYKTTDWMLNPAGTVHGGMICTMFDITMGITSMAMSGTYTPTVNLAVSYLSPLPNNDKFVVKANATRVGKTFVQLTAEGWAESTRTLCATATAIFYCGAQQKVVYRIEKKDEL